MPAITLPRLRQQAALLAESYDQPAVFVRSLHHLLEFYADRTQRPGQSGEPDPLVKSYRVPPAVLRQVLLELMPLADAQPEKALVLCDALWAEGTLEYRLLAAGLLGTIPPVPVDPVLKRVEAWCLSNTENRLINALLTDGMARLRKEAPAKVILQIKAWLESGRFYTQQLGLRSLLPLLSKQDDEALPIFYRLITPLVRVAPANLRPDLLDVLRGLARRSPRETAYFLRQTLELPNSPDTPWLVRQCAADFPGDLQASLRAASRISEKQT